MTIEPSHDDTPLDALLQRPLEALADDGFSAAVMRRVRAEPAPLVMIDGGVALEQLRRRGAREQRFARWRRGGLAVGVLVAAASWWAGAGAAAALPPPDALALLLGLGAAGWLLAAEALRGEFD